MRSRTCAIGKQAPSSRILRHRHVRKLTLPCAPARAALHDSAWSAERSAGERQTLPLFRHSPVIALSVLVCLAPFVA